MFTKILLALFTVLFVVITLMPFVRSDYWTFRILEYPRLQKLFVGLAVLAGVLFFRETLAGWFWWMAVPLFACIAYLCVKIFPYTPLSGKQMLQVNEATGKNDVTIFTANVLQENQERGQLLSQIRQMNPDIVFLVETDTGWQKEMRPLETEYPYTLSHPLSNTYGLLLYSRLKLINPEVRFIVKKEIPSISATVLLPGGKQVRLIGLHPEPPVPGESMHSTAKDKELMKVAMELEHYKEPAIVMGDLNDVAWSHVTELFQEVSNLIDPRRGRGFYSTFNAKHWWMRFPLDYIFCSAHFGLVEMKRMPYNGSDHFPMFIHLQYNEQYNNIQETPDADKEEEKEAKKKASKATVE